MLYLIWAIVFVAAFLYFGYVVIVGGKLVRQKLGSIAALVFIGGLLSFSGNSHHSNTYQHVTEINGIEKWVFADEDTLEKGMLWVNWIRVDSNLLNKYSLTYTCGFDKQTHKHIAVSASVSTTGWTVGTTWDTQRIELVTTEDNEHVKYTILGTVNWRLLGFTVYTQSKNYTGLAPIINHL